MTNETKALAPVEPMAMVQSPLAQAMATQAEAQVKARWFLAQQCPRNLAQVRKELLDECKRPEFAKTAWFKKPIGDGVEGLSIRFAETAAQRMGNIDTGQRPIHEDHATQTVEVYAIDLERNTSHTRTITVEKVVERNYPSGREVLRQRPGSKGKTVYTLRATADEMVGEVNKAAAKALRVSIFKVLPADLVAECKEQVLETRKAGTKAIDPKKAAKDVADNFADLGVEPEDLAKYLGHDLNKATKLKIQELRDLYACIRDGEINWIDAVDERVREREEAEAKKRKIKAAASGVADRMKKMGLKIGTTDEALEPDPDTVVIDPAASTTASPWPAVGPAEWLTACGEAGMKKPSERAKLIKKRFGPYATEKNIGDHARGELLAWLLQDPDACESMDAAVAAMKAAEE